MAGRQYRRPTHHPDQSQMKLSTALQRRSVERYCGAVSEGSLHHCRCWYPKSEPRSELDPISRAKEFAIAVKEKRHRDEHDGYERQKGVCPACEISTQIAYSTGVQDALPYPSALYMSNPQSGNTAATADLSTVFAAIADAAYNSNTSMR